MSDCFANVRVEDMDHCANDELASGISETQIFYAPAAHVDVFPELAALGDATKPLADYATISSDITFLTGNGFNVLHIQAETGEVTDEPVGNKGNKKIKSAFSFFLPNTHARNLGFVRQFKNVGMVFVIKEKSKRLRLLGSKDIPAYISEGSGTTGKGSEDDSGFELTVDVTTSSPAPVYTGVVTLKPTV